MSGFGSRVWRGENSAVGWKGKEPHFPLPESDALRGEAVLCAAVGSVAIVFLKVEPCG